MNWLISKIYLNKSKSNLSAAEYSIKSYVKHKKESISHLLTINAKQLQLVRRMYGALYHFIAGATSIVVRISIQLLLVIGPQIVQISHVVLRCAALTNVRLFAECA